MAIRSDATCYICGEASSTTKDHVFPRGLFPPPRPELLTAPACADCQQRLQPDEEYFRTFAAAGAYQNESARKLWTGKITRSFDDSPAFRVSFAKAMRTVDYISRGGVYLGKFVGLDGDKERIGNVLRKIVRGLFYLDAGKTLMPSDVRWNYWQVSPLSPDVPDFVRDQLHTMALKRVGEVVDYKFGHSSAEPRLTVSLLAFYKRAMFVVLTGPEVLE